MYYTLRDVEGLYLELQCRSKCVLCVKLGELLTCVDGSSDEMSVPVGEEDLQGEDEVVSLLPPNLVDQRRIAD